jgi:O-antigen/teichoic acid export membrane protein
VQVLTAIIASAIAYFFAKPYMRFDKVIDWKWVKELFRFGKFVMGSNLSTMVYKSIDKFMLAVLLSPAAVTAYEAAIKVTNMAEIPTFSMASILFPQSARRMKEGNTVIKELYEKAVGAIFALLIPGIIFVLIFADWIIWIVAGEKYLDSAYLLRLTILYGLFIPFAVQFGTVLDSIGKPKINFWFTLGGAVLNIVLNFVFISYFGIVGAAYGTLVTYLVAFGGMQYILHKMLDVKAYRVFYYMFDFYGQIWNMIKEKISGSKEPLGNSKAL